MDPESAVSPALPIYALGPLLLISLFVIWRQAQRSRSEATAFIITALGLRVVLAALHVITFSSSPIGLTWNALASLGVCGVGFFLIRRRAGTGLVLVPVALLIGWMVLSAALNRGDGVGTSAIIKLVYFGVIAILSAQACKEVGVQRMITLLLPVAFLPILFQVAGIPLGVVKASESDGSASYIGGFHHEAAFSLLLLMSIMLACLLPKLRFSARLGLIGGCMLSVLLANYRTSIIAALPLIGYTLFAEATRSFLPTQRKLIGMLALFLVAGAGVGAVALYGDRFADLGTVVSQSSDLIQRPGDANEADRKLLSGRIVIWDSYIYGWIDSHPTQQAFGHGPDSWGRAFTIYAHNTLVSALYELGVGGVIFYLGFWAWFLALSIIAPSPQRYYLVVAHAGFVLLNMATMPMWMIEGMIYYAVLCGVTVYYAREAVLRRKGRVMPSERGHVYQMG